MAGRVSRGQWQTIAAIYMLVVTPMQALTFLLFSANACRDNPVVALLEQDAGELYDDDCAWDQGSTANVFGVALWFCTGIAMLWVGEPKPHVPPPAEMQTVSYQRQTMPDGTVAVQEVAVIKGTAVPPPAENA